MSQPTSLLAGLALGQQTCFVKYNINLSACSAPGRQTCGLAHEDFCLNNWANVVSLSGSNIFDCTTTNEPASLEACVHNPMT
jgi:hypothetical protein